MFTELGGHVTPSLPSNADVTADHHGRAERIRERTYFSVYLHDIAQSTHLGRPRRWAMDPLICERAFNWASHILASDEDKRLSATVHIRHIWETSNQMTDEAVHDQLALWYNQWHKHVCEFPSPFSLLTQLLANYLSTGMSACCILSARSLCLSLGRLTMRRPNGCMRWH